VEKLLCFCRSYRSSTIRLDCSKQYHVFRTKFKSIAISSTVHLSLSKHGTQHYLFHTKLKSIAISSRPYGIFISIKHSFSELNELSVSARRTVEMHRACYSGLCDAKYRVTRRSRWDCSKIVKTVQ
jgi:hypothetical protein